MLSTYREKFTEEDVKWPINIWKDVNLICKVIKWVRISTKLAEIKAIDHIQVGKNVYVYDFDFILFLTGVKIGLVFLESYLTL